MLKHFLTPNSKLEQFLVEKIVENCESAETFWGDDIFFKFGLQYSHIKRRFQMKNRLNFETIAFHNFQYSTSYYLKYPKMQ